MVLDVITFQTKDFFVICLEQLNTIILVKNEARGLGCLTKRPSHSPKALTKSHFKLIPSEGNAFLNYICLRGLPC